MSDLWGRCPGLIDYCSEDVHGVANEEWGRTVYKLNNSEKSKRDLKKLGS